MTKNNGWQVKSREGRDLVSQILYVRGYKTEAEVKEFLNPAPPAKLLENLELFGLTETVLNDIVFLVKKALRENRSIIIHGDYDVDGICATAIIWKTIYQDLDYKKCLPFIPNRFDHGYGLSKESIDSISNLGDLGDLSHLNPLLITVDCGITSLSEIEYAKEKGFEVLIFDHHVKPEKLPDCNILWTDKLCAAGIAWVFAEKLRNNLPVRNLDLAALATIADIQPLTGANRSLVKYGLEELSCTRSIGLNELIKVSGIEGKKIGTFEVGWILAPRLNASGRLESALESLRLLCTRDAAQAQEISQKLNQTNRERQELTKEMVEMAKEQLTNSNGQSTKINIAIHENFHEGVIGLVAGKLVSHFGSPAVVIRKGGEFSKASARSVSGFNIVEFLRSLGDHFENVGGHAGAAGFTIRTEKIEDFLSAVQGQMSVVNLPEPVLTVDAKVRFEELTLETLNRINELEPFGLGNPEPVFLLEGATIVSARTVGSQNQHLKLKISNGQMSSTNTIDCIGFDLGTRAADMASDELANLIFTLSEDTFSGYPKLVLRLKDLEEIPNAVEG